jgi:hypothetical protein
LYDDAGNGCDSRDAFGLVRNPPAGPCYAGDGTTRPAYDTYRVAAAHLSDVQPDWRSRPTPNQELIAFRQPSTGQRLVFMWARAYVSETVTLTATDSTASLIFPDGTAQTITPTDGVYTITLPAATNRNAPTPDGSEPDGTSAIGGSPRILIERDSAIAVTP